MQSRKFNDPACSFRCVRHARSVFIFNIPRYSSRVVCFLRYPEGDIREDFLERIGNSTDHDFLLFLLAIGSPSFRSLPFFKSTEELMLARNINFERTRYREPQSATLKSLQTMVLVIPRLTRLFLF